MTIRVAVAGAAGRMGRMLVAAVTAADDLQLGAALEDAASPHVNADAGAVAGIGNVDVPIIAHVAVAADDFGCTTNLR